MESYAGLLMPLPGYSVEDAEEDDEWEAEDEEAIGRASLAMSMDAVARAQVHIPSLSHRKPQCVLFLGPVSCLPTAPLISKVEVNSLVAASALFWSYLLIAA